MTVKRGAIDLGPFDDCADPHRLESLLEDEREEGITQHLLCVPHARIWF
jgi:hypothetical protein